MSTTAPASAEQAGDGNIGALPPSHDQSWISALVDSLVPKFQAQGSSATGESAMQTDAQGKYGPKP
ncbi:hypothetical protein PtB15_3B276 [Puccinia triticina]|nr:hypothetical protein PtB15_3B276 [Puccinia triticina]